MIKQKTKGYVAVLVAIFIPLILLAAKLVLDLMTLHDTQISTVEGGNLERHCAKQAALAVAQNWNPGIGLDCQKRALLKVADGVYNDCVPHIDGAGDLVKAVPGLQVEIKDKIIKGKGFDPMRVTKKNILSEDTKIKYKNASKYLLKQKILAGNTRLSVPWNLPFVAWKLVDKLTSAAIAYDKFDELDQEQRALGKYVLNHIDRYQYPHQRYVRTATGYPTHEFFLPSCDFGFDVDFCLVSSAKNNADESGYTEAFGQSVTEPSAQVEIEMDFAAENIGEYTERKREDDRVQIAIENDQIKVTTDSDVGYAVPAQCNVDIVLACPTNAAAANENNRDKNSENAEMPYLSAESFYNGSEPPAEAKSCPIYQIGQAFRAFAKEFYHTSGVTMGLIPYSGKVSLSPDVAEAYTWSYSTPNHVHFRQDLFLEQNTCPAYLRGAVMYDSYGMTDKELNNGYKWNTLLTACPIRCRAGAKDGGGNSQDVEQNCGGNVIFRGDILSNAPPSGSGTSTDLSTMFFRQNSNPCRGGCANLLSMRCEIDCPVYLPNPYYIIEPTANVQKIYEICGALQPFYDEYNVSNFIFIALTWADNLWQSWTNDPKCDASENNLSIPSKMDAGRKKVLILVVNKPDWFEPNELTYLGFDNDFSETPMVESDRIDFSQNYADTSKKFADETNYDGTIQGAKKILKFEGTNIFRNEKTGYYECVNSTDTAHGELSFPKKYLVKIVVEPKKNLIWSSLGQLFTEYNTINWGRIDWDGGKFCLVTNNTDKILTSSDGKMWTTQEADAQSNSCATYGDGKWFVAGYGTGSSKVLADGVWKTVDTGESSEVSGYGNGLFMVLRPDCNAYTSTNCETWTKKGNSTWSRSLGYHNGKWCAVCWDGKFRVSSDDGETWEVMSKNEASPAAVTGFSSEWYGVVYAYGRYWAVSCNGDCPVVSSEDGETWEKDVDLKTLGGGVYRNLGTNGKLLISSSDNGFFAIGERTAAIKFTNLIGKTGGVSENNTIDGRKEFYIESDQISGNTITFDMQNIRLISAEITNRPYVRKVSTCRLDGTNIKTNVKRPMTLKINMDNSQSSITFSNCNNSNMGVENMGSHTLSQSKSFIFPATNFEKNFTTKKIQYTAHNAAISIMTLSQQIYRLNLGKNYYDNNNGNIGKLENIQYISLDSGIANTNTNTIYWQGDEGVTVKNAAGVHENTADWALNAYDTEAAVTIEYFCGMNYYDLSMSTGGGSDEKPTLFLNYQKSAEPIDNPVFTEKNILETPDSFPIITSFNVPGSGNYTYLRIAEEIAPQLNYWYSFNNISLQNNQVVSMLDNQVWLEDGVICFRGTGELSVIVEPKINGAVTYTSPSSEEVKAIFTESQTITIDPDNYKYEGPDENGEYTIKLTVDNVVLSDLTLVEQSEFFEWGKIRLPDMASYIDYSVNPYKAYFCSSSGSFFESNWEYDGSFYTNKNVGGYSTEIVRDRRGGDHTSLTYSDESYELHNFCKDGHSVFGNDGRTRKKYDISGLSRTYTPQNHYLDIYFGGMLNDYIAKTPRSINLIMQTMTLPVNTVLYYAYKDGDVHEGEWYPKKSEQLDPDASEAAKNVTKDACNKLKKDNIRIYLIKYRKQKRYKQGDTVTDYDYAYLNDCTAPERIYDIDEPEDAESSYQETLINTMKNIAEDIKEWAGYEEAQIKE